jgi:hypothetical protein
MRRTLLAASLLAASLGFMALPAGADTPTTSVDPPVLLAFDFSDNSQPAAVSNGTFNVITDVLALTGHGGGIVRMVAVSPSDSGQPNLVCAYQPVQQGQVECGFNFTTNGVWQVRAEWTDVKADAVQVVSITDLRVSN